MSNKQAKKLRQLYRKDIRTHLDLMGKSIRKKPRWCPHFFWVFMVKQVINF